MAKDRSKWHDELGRFAKGHGYVQRRNGLKRVASGQIRRATPEEHQKLLRMGSVLTFYRRNVGPVEVDGTVMTWSHLHKPSWAVVKRIVETYGETLDRDVYPLTKRELVELAKTI